ncbi:hypothetical protein BK131_06895 [Paenibacillus amylolyticus]|uniref:Uncharacterized protein n=1 Tax=Paenibacillus amylolyticus TaxID=1451 RepID=A0A100VKC1_PAEAM|nr:MULTISPECIES: hypothetical protein [Paenibacillus]OMF17674.1 hypothetical protein BK131_06895 [Paenibacillus amylolyticus]GAS81418.1 unknown protein [Paenibacillus amylolyticus]
MRTFITRYKGGHNPHEFRVYVIQSSTLKRFVVMEIILGSIVYNVALYLFHNALLAGVGSWAGTESLKRLPLVFRRIAGT